MSTSNEGIDDSTYVQLKALIYAKSIKTIANWKYFLRAVSKESNYIHYR